MAFKKIEEADLIGKLVSDLPDSPEITAGELKEHFDKLSKEAIIPHFNELVDDLHAESASGNIGMSVPEGIEAEPNVGAVVGKVAEMAKENGAVKHSHENKSILDSITELVKEGYDRLVLLFQNIESISDTVSDDSAQLPTGKAIVAYVRKLGGGDMQTSVYDTNNNGIVDDSEKLGGKLPSVYQEVTDGTLQTENKTIPGAINELFNRKQASTASDLEYDNSKSGLTATNGQGAIDELAESFSTAANDIGDAIAATGVTVPDGTALSDMAALITNNLYRVLTTATASMSRTISNSEWALGATATIVPYGSATIIGNAIQYSNNGILVKAPMKKAKVTVRMAALNTSSTAHYAATNEIRLNGSAVKSGAFNVAGKTLTEGSLEFTIENLKEGDIITHYIYRASGASGYPAYREAYMTCTFTK